MAELSKAELSKAELSMAELSKAELSQAELSKAELSKAELSTTLNMLIRIVADGYRRHSLRSVKRPHACTEIKLQAKQSKSKKAQRKHTLTAMSFMFCASPICGLEVTREDLWAEDKSQEAEGMEVRWLKWRRDLNASECHRDWLMKGHMYVHAHAW